MQEHKEEELFALIERVGSKSNYQRRIFLLFSGAWFLTGFLILSVSFLFMPASFRCSQNISARDCQLDVCAKQEDEWGRFEQRNGVSSILMEYGKYQCHYAFWIQVYKSILFSGILTGYLSFNYLPAAVGRRKTIIAAWATACGGLIIVNLSSGVLWACLGLFIAATGSTASLRISRAIINETVDFTLRQTYYLILQGSFSFSGIAVSMAYYILTDWRTVNLFCCILPALTILLIMVLNLEETPNYLIHDPRTLLRSLHRIAITNRLECDITQAEIGTIIEHQNQQKQEQDKSTFQIRDLFKYQSLLHPTKWLSLMAVSLAFLYLGPSTFLPAFAIDHFVLQAASSFSESIACLLACYKINTTRRRTSSILTTLLTALVSSLGSIFGRNQMCSLCGKNITRLVLIMISRFCVSYCCCIFLLYIVEIYPKPVKIIGFNVVTGIGAIGGIIILNVLAIPIYFHHDPLIYIAGMAYLGCWAARKLPQTQGCPHETHIAQLRPEKVKKCYEPSLEESSADLGGQEGLSERRITSMQSILETDNQ